MVQIMNNHRLACLFVLATTSLGNAFITTTSTIVKQSSTIFRTSDNTKSSSSTSSLNLGPQEAWTAYNDALQTNPLVVKSVTASVILGAADFAGQAIESAIKDEGESSSSDDDDNGVDFARAARFAFFGLVLQAPWNHFYYTFLDGAIPPTEDPFTATTGIKVVIDQFVQAPVFTVLIFAFLGFLEGKNAEAIKKQLENDYADTMIANWVRFFFVMPFQKS